MPSNTQQWGLFRTWGHTFFHSKIALENKDYILVWDLTSLEKIKPYLMPQSFVTFPIGAVPWRLNSHIIHEDSSIWDFDLYRKVIGLHQNALAFSSRKMWGHLVNGNALLRRKQLGILH